MKQRTDLPGWIGWLGRGGLRLIGFKSRMLPGGVHIMERAGRHEHAKNLLFIHGIGADLVNWAPTAFFLGRRDTIRLLDLPGHGASHDVAPVDLDTLNATILNAVTGLPPSIVIGNSLGGAVALRLAVQAKDHVQALYLLSPAGAPMGPADFKETIGQFDMTTWAHGRTFVRRLSGRYPVYGPLIVPVVLRIFARPFLLQLRVTFRPEGALTAAEARAIRVPVTLSWGARDGMLPVTLRDWLVEHIPHAERQDHADEAHSPQMEHPLRIARRLRQFIDGVS